LETFVIGFVVEQTGYPREIVELDADLEGDLGIDSIRKAQLFGEIGQRYGLSADASVSLDDFRTLRHLLDYMLPRVGGAAGGSAAADALAVPAAASAPVVSPSIVSAPTVAVAAAMPAAASELETFVIGFVVEQTGYPREIVELDADLEGDLGIDSIRKAQLFGEIGQRYGLSADASVSLDDFRTLRHLLDYMLPRVGGAPGGSAVADAPAAPMPAAAGTPLPSESFLRGRAEGQQHAVAIRRWCRELVAAGRVGKVPSAFAADTAEFLAGVADAVGVDRGVLESGLSAPTVALGGIDLLVDLSGRDLSGLLLGFGRYAEPVVREVAASTTLLAVAGLPGAVAGWNTSGLMALLTPRAGAAAILALPRIVTGCRSAADLAAAGPWPEGILVVSPPTAEIWESDSAGHLQPTSPCHRESAEGSAVTRILLGAAPATPLPALFAAAAGGLPAALSSAATWLAAGSGANGPRSLAGGPLGAGQLITAAASMAELFPAHPGHTAAPPFPASASGITRRYGLAVREIATTAGTNLAGERVLVLGAGPAVPAILERIRAGGGKAVAGEAGTVADAVAAIDAAEAAGPVRHLIVVTPPTDAPAWSADGAAAVAALFAGCQRWIIARASAADIARSTLTAATSLGGDFGLGGDIGWVGSGAVTGLFKNLAHEFASLKVRVVDFQAMAAPVEQAERLVAEIGAAGPVEIGYRQGRRVEVVPTTGGPVSATRLDGLQQGSVWIVTGGARGVTAACALELGRRHGLELILVGSTRPEPVEPAWLRADEAGLRDLKGRIMIAAKSHGADPRQAWRSVEKSIEIARSLEAFHAAGVHVWYEACDLGDAAAVQRLVDTVSQSMGPIRGIVHGAGWESACRFEKKTLEGLAATIGPKCLGLEHLLHAASRQPIGALIAFGSTSGRLGGHGQADYSLANDLLAKLVASARRRRPGLRATTFHWHAWDEVGMASRPESRFVLEQFGLKFMPLAEGVGRFLAEIEAGLPDAEVLVTEPVFCPDAPIAAAPLPARRARGSLVEAVEGSGVGSEVSFIVSPTSDTFLADHRRSGRPLLPAVIDAELLAQAALAADVPGGVREIRDFRVERGLVFQTNDPRRLIVSLKPAADGSLAASLREAEASPGGRPLASGTVVPAPCEAVTATLDEMPFPWNPVVYREDGPMWHGPAFRTLSGLLLDRNGGWGKLTAPDPDRVAGPRGAQGWTVPAALLDGALFACGVYSYILCGKRVEIPVRFGRLRFVSDPVVGETCVVRLLFVSQDAQETVYDLVIFGADGRVILSLERLAMSGLAAERSRPT
jgi:acyl carrier protein